MTDDVKRLREWAADVRFDGDEDDADAALLDRAADALTREPVLLKVAESLRETVGILEMLGHDGKDTGCEWCGRASRAHDALRALDEASP